MENEELLEKSVGNIDETHQNDSQEFDSSFSQKLILEEEFSMNDIPIANVESPVKTMEPSENGETSNEEPKSDDAKIDTNTAAPHIEPESQDLFQSQDCAESTLNEHIPDSISKVCLNNEENKIEDQNGTPENAANTNDTTNRKRKGSESDASPPVKIVRNESESLEDIENKQKVKLNSDEIVSIVLNESESSTDCMLLDSSSINCVEDVQAAPEIKDTSISIVSEAMKIEPEISIAVVETTDVSENCISGAEALKSESNIPEQVEICPMAEENTNANISETDKITVDESTDKIITDESTDKITTDESTDVVEHVKIDVPEVSKTSAQVPDVINPQSPPNKKNDSPITCLKDVSPKQNGDNLDETPELLNDSINIKHPFSDITEGTPESRSDDLYKKHAFYVEIIYKVDEVKSLQKEITRVFCEDVTDLQLADTKKVLDVSSGALGDVSKNSSPSSVVSNAGPFALSNRYSTLSQSSRLSTMSRMSTSSTSSALSSASAFASRMSQRDDMFLIPDMPNSRAKDKPLNVDKKLSSEQIELLKARWNNSEQLFAILYAIDNSVHSGTFSNDVSPMVPITEPIVVSDLPEAPQTKDRILDKINEEVTITPKTEKRPVRKRISKSETEPTTLAKPKSVRKTKRSGSSSSSTSAQDCAVTPDRTVINYSNVSQGIAPGQRVFARWTDRKYYSGVIAEHVKDNKWQVQFDDGNKKVLIEDYILGGFHTLLKGHSVYAMVPDKQEYDSGIVTQLWMENHSVRYEIEVDSGPPVTVSPEDLFLTEDQVKVIREANPSGTPPGTPKSVGTVSLDNIVDGKRATRSTRKAGSLNSPKPSGSGTRKVTPRRLDSDDEKADAKSDSALEEVGGVEPELKVNTPIKGGKGPGRMKGQKRPPRFKLNDELFSLDFGPIPEKGSDIFKKMSFLLVCARTPQLKDGDVTSGNTTDGSVTSVESGSETDVETMEFAKIPFHEERLKQQIIAGGGKIYQHFEDIPTGEYKSCKLISNRPNKTAKYIQCMAAGITVLCHEWVVRCCRDNKRVAFQELPLGWSLERKKFIDSFARKTTKPLQNLLVVLAPNPDKQFTKFWERVCILAGGTVLVMDSEDIDFQTATLVLADNECSERVVDRALSWNIPLLSTVWVVQTIIHGETRAFDGHPRYAYDSIESE